MLRTRLFITVGDGGSRTDFMAGWLGSLPNFVDSQWHIDPTTGRSFTLANKLKILDQPNISLSAVLQDHNICLDPDSNLYFSGACHRRNLTNNLTTQDLKSTNIIVINTDQADIKKIQWEFVVKTYFSKHRTETAFQNHMLYNIDHVLANNNLPITDQNRVTAITNKIDEIKTTNYKTVELDTVPTIEADYNQLFVPGGSRYLINKINLTCSDRYHAFWDLNLPMANSPLSITQFGHTWRFDQFIE